jgi:hypothetical protein
MRAVLLAAASALALAVPASAGTAREARVSGPYRVTYVKVAGKAYAGGTSSFRWAAVPECERGPCTTRVESRYKDGTPSAQLLFKFDGTTYEWSQSVKGAVDCEDSTGKTATIRKAYDVSILTRFRVTRMSDSGRALAFTGTSSTRFKANALGRAHGCGYYTDTEHLTGYAMTAP